MYISVTLGGTRQRTRIIKRNLSPEWNEDLILYVYSRFAGGKNCPHPCPARLSLSVPSSSSRLSTNTGRDVNRALAKPESGSQTS